MVHMLLLTDIREAPFIYDAWNSPEVLESLSRIAGIELVPAMDIDIGHCNVSFRAEGEEVTEESNKDMTAFEWHYDSYAFVCVIMLSDCTGMMGGETVIRCGNGETLKARGPTMVSTLMTMINAFS
jgi:hypothetical protein